MWFSTYSTRKYTTISHTHSKWLLLFRRFSNQISCSCKEKIKLIWFSCSFVSVVHLLVGVTYCLISWTVGLPKRAVSSCIYIQVNFLKKWDTQVRLTMYITQTLLLICSKLALIDLHLSKICDYSPSIRNFWHCLLR